jgi:hypothetical protein
MPLYPMQCALPTFAEQGDSPVWCGHQFDWYATTGLYERSQRVDFRNVHCPRCGRMGGRRVWSGEDAAPLVSRTVGVWGEAAPKGLRGLRYENKEERDEQMHAHGTREDIIVPTEREGLGKFKGIPKPPKPPRDWAVATEPVVPEPRARDRIAAYLRENGKRRISQIIADLDMNPNTVNAAIRSSSEIERAARGVYQVTS